MREYTEKLLEKLRESTAAVLPIAGIVLVLCFALVPVPSGILLCFLAGAVLLTVGGCSLIWERRWPCRPSVNGWARL